MFTAPMIDSSPAHQMCRAGDSYAERVDLARALRCFISR